MENTFSHLINTKKKHGSEIKLMFKVVDNFLDKEDFMKLQHHMLVEKFFPWYFQDTKDFEVDEDLNQYQFTHTFYKNYQPFVAPFLQFSNYFSLLEPLLKKLKVKSLIKVKANLNPYSPKLYKGHFHTDTPFNSLTAIYYLNENNGYTLFEKNNKKVKSEENRIVIFDAKMKHVGTNTTNRKKRVVLNLNYF